MGIKGMAVEGENNRAGKNTAKPADCTGAGPVGGKKGKGAGGQLPEPAYLARPLFSQAYRFMQHHRMTISRTAHYYTLGKPGPDIRQFWLCCHGYAQLASEFIDDFESLVNPQTLVVAPEGLNYFYKHGVTGPVGSSWMTKLHREDHIRDYVAFLHELYEKYIALLPAGVRVVLLGFSQGTATICRYILHHKPHFHDLVLWGGLPPEDLDYGANRAYFASKNLYLLYGAHDPFLTPDRLADLQELEAKSGVDFDETSFEGGHEIPPDVLNALRDKMEEE
jgi:predicted esterase